MNDRELVHLNGRTLPRAEARVSAFDRGFLYGDGFFETMRIHRGRPLLLRRHLERLVQSCEATGFGRAVDPDRIAATVGDLIAANGIAEGYLRVTVSRGEHDGRLTRLECPEPTVLVEARPADLPPPEGPPPIALCVAPEVRPAGAPALRHKSLSYQPNLLALAAGRGRGADEVVFLNSDRRLAEGAVSNLFLVRDGTVCTPSVDCGLLPGITRAVVLELCRREGLPVEEGHYGAECLRSAGEVFCTNSLRGLMPVGRILEPERRLDAPGPATRRLRTLYGAYVREHRADR